MKSRRILKFKVKHGETAVQMPNGAKIVAVGHQIRGSTFDSAQIWADCTLENGHLGLGERCDCRVFLVAATGEAVPDTAEYVGTAKTDGGQFIWHVFEIPEKRINAGIFDG